MMTAAYSQEPVTQPSATQTSATQLSEAPPLAYATPVGRVVSRGWAGAAVILGGLCLIALGGCFLIGVLVLVTRIDFNGNTAAVPAPLTVPQGILMFVLYVLAFASFAGAGAMLVAGTRGLLRFMRT